MNRSKHFFIYSILFLSLVINNASASNAPDLQDVTGEPLFIKGNYKDLLKKYQHILDKAEASDIKDITHANALQNMAILYYKIGFYKEAEPLYKKALLIKEKILNSFHPDVAFNLTGLALLYVAQDRNMEAEHLYKRALLIFEKSRGPDNHMVAALLNNLGVLYTNQARYTEAEHLYKKALLIFEKSLGPNHPKVATNLNNLAFLYATQSHYTEAESLYKKARFIYEKSLGENHPKVASNLNNLAALYGDQNRNLEAETLYKRALLIYEISLGSNHHKVALNLNNLAALYGDHDRNSEAETLYKKALLINEKSLGPNHPMVALNLNNLANLYNNQARYSDAEPLLKRALLINEKSLRQNHPDVALNLNNLALSYANQSRYSDAEPLLKRALLINEKSLGPNHPKVALNLNNLAYLYSNQVRYSDAEPLLKRALLINEKSLGQNHPNVALNLNNLAFLYATQSHYTEAEPLYRKALLIYEKSLGPNHPNVALNLNNLALLYSDQARYSDAEPLLKRAVNILQNRYISSRQKNPTNFSSKHISNRFYFTNYVSLLTKLIKQQPDSKYEFTQTAFEISQLASQNSTATDISNMASRFASDNSALVKLVRDRQDTQKHWQALDEMLIKSFGKSNKTGMSKSNKKIQEEITTAKNKIQNIDTTLTQLFPQYQELTNPKPLQIKDVQKLLNVDEALISYLVDSEGSYLWVVRKDNASMHRIELSTKDVNKKVRYLRQHLDTSGISTLDQMPPFPVKEAHEFYQDIFLPALPLLQGIKHLIIVPDGPLQKLPFGVLVTNPYEEELTDPKSHRSVPWLAKDYALTVLPAVSSLRALRSFAKKYSGSEPFIGFGDPLFSQEKKIPVKFSTLFSRGAIANVEEVRKFQTLPETASELYSIAQTLNAPSNNVYLRERATEHKVRTMDLTPYRTIAFATHGLMAGQFTGFTEPALVLTPPQKGTEKDDGLLTATEIAQLDLNADWVILSACNTAAGDSPGAEGLTGLAKAFFYAGTRTLLVSHWSIFSNASTALTTQLFKQLRNNPSIGKSEALRRSMLTLMNSNEETYYAHPMAWAPFIVVGEGL